MKAAFLMAPDYYELLSVPRIASRSEISRAYRVLALRYHPDKNADPSALSTFLRISEAYNTLKNQALRSQYDFQTSFSTLYNFVTTGPYSNTPADNLSTMVQTMLGELHETQPHADSDDMDAFSLFYTEKQHCKLCGSPLPVRRERLHFLTEHFPQYVKWKNRRSVPPTKKRKTTTSV